MIDIDKAVRDYYYTHHSDLDDRHYDNCIRDLVALLNAWGDAKLEEAAMSLSSDYYEQAELAMRFIARIRRLKSTKLSSHGETDVE